MRLSALLLFACQLTYPAAVDVRIDTGPFGAGTFYLDFQLNDSGLSGLVFARVA